MHTAHQSLQLTIVGLVFLLGYSQIGLLQTAIWPAIGLSTKSPYISIWTSGPYTGYDDISASNFATNPLTLLVKLNNTIYTILPGGETVLETGFKVTPTQSIFNFTIGPVNFTYNFFTPIDANDLKRLSLPVSYLAVSAQSTDNQTHLVQIIVGWCGECSSRDVNEKIQGKYRHLGPLIDLYTEEKNQEPLSEYHNLPLWGKSHLFTSSLGTTFGVNNTGYLTTDFIKECRRHSTMDHNFTLFYNSSLAMSFAKEINAGPSPSPNAFFGISWVARPAVNTTDGPMNHLWEDFFNGDEKQMIRFAFEDAEDALARCEVFDDKVWVDATTEGGQNQFTIVTDRLREAFGGIELVGTQNHTWAFFKDMRLLSGQGSCQSVYSIDSNKATYLKLNPRILKYLLEPLLVYQESQLFTREQALSDLGAAYPQCTGGHDRPIGTEESANMITMIDDYVRASNDTDFVRQHIVVCKKWADNLASRGLYPGEALKGIISGI